MVCSNSDVPVTLSAVLAGPAHIYSKERAGFKLRQKIVPVGDEWSWRGTYFLPHLPVSLRHTIVRWKICSLLPYSPSNAVENWRPCNILPNYGHVAGVLVRLALEPGLASTHCEDLYDITSTRIACYIAGYSQCSRKIMQIQHTKALWSVNETAIYYYFTFQAAGSASAISVVSIADLLVSVLQYYVMPAHVVKSD